MPARRGEKKGGTVKPKKRGKGAEVSSRSAGDGKKTDSASAVAVSNNGASKEGKQHPTAGPTVAEYVVRQEPTTIDLQAVVKKRQKLAEELQTVEKQIFDLETRYLENSHPLGNAIKGYEGLLMQNQASNRRILVRQEDRLFSNSSLSGIPH